MPWLFDPVLPTVLIVIGIVWGCVWLTRQQVPVWLSDRTLWAHAMVEAPEKPRPWLNHGTELVKAGEFALARVAYQRALDLTALPHVPEGDRIEIGDAARQNLAALDALEASWR